MIGSETADGERKLDRLLTDRIEESLAQGRDQLMQDPHGAARAALAFDGYITLPDGKTDAVYVEARDYSAGGPFSFEIAVPYRNKPDVARFTVYRPKLLKVPQLETCESLLKAFWNGVRLAREGRRLLERASRPDPLIHVRRSGCLHVLEVIDS